jgi:hypothetical protein
LVTWIKVFGLVLAGNIKVLFNSSGAIGLVGANYGTAGQILMSNGPSSAATWSPPSSFSGGTVDNDSNFASTTASTSTTSGAVVIGGGLGVGGAVFAGSLQNTPIGSTTRNTGAFTSLTSNGATTFTAGTASSSISTGTLVVTGGVGISGAVYTGSTINMGGVASFTSNTASSSTTSGSIVVTGGVGVSGRVTANDFNGVTVPTGGSAPGANAFVRTEGTGYTYVNYINSNTTNNENPAISQFIVQNATDTFYRKASVAHVKSGLGITPIIGAPASLYGAVAIQGEKNGWSGISFRNTANALCGTLMMTTTAQGIYNAADNAWLLQWDQAGNFTATANVTAYSDERLKENIEVIPNALNKVMQLNGVTFTRKDNGERGTGLVAQNLQTVLPESVLADKEGMLSVAYGNTVGLLIEAMKEQQAQIESLRAEIAALKGK